MVTIDIYAGFLRPKRGHITRQVPLSAPPHPSMADRFGYRLAWFDTEAGALQALEREARYLAFADLTGLRPSRAHASLYRGHPEREGFDHTCCWHAGHGLGRIVTTEPYADTAEAVRWCESAGWRYAIARPGIGMWFPPSTHLLVMAPRVRGGDPAAVVRTLEARMPATAP